MLYNLKSTITKIGFGAVIALLVGCNNNVEKPVGGINLS